MADNLIEAIEKNLGISPITKIDPNTQDVKQTADNTSYRSLDQAAIPAALAGLYNYSRTENGTSTILNGSTDSWINTFFVDSADEMVAHAAEYANASKEDTYQKMETVAREAVSIARKNVKDSNDTTGLHDYLRSQRREILTYLPAELHLGDVIGEKVLDDRTNKMEGPLSSFMQRLANLFDSTEKAPQSKAHF
jgi:hypothetical protein